MKSNQSPMHALPHWVLVSLLSAICGLGIFSTYIYIPSLPQIAEEFLAADILVKLTIAVGFFGAGIGQLILGPFSDFFGRRNLAIVSLTIFIFASFGAGMSPTISLLIVMRFLQGVSAGTGLVIVRAVARDLFSGKDFVKFMTTIVMVISISPAIAPIIGGYLQTFFNWRASFYFLGLCTIFILLFVVNVMGESNVNTSQKSEKISDVLIGIKKNYSILGCDSYFMASSLTLGLAFSSTICMSTMFPFIFTDFGWSVEEIGYVSAVFAIGNILGSVLSRKLADKYPSHTVILGGVVVNIGIALIALMYHMMFGVSAEILLGVVILVLCITMLIQSNASALALSEHSMRAGTAASLLGGIHIGSGAFGAILAGILPDTISNLFFVNLMIFCLCFGLVYRYITLRNN